MKEKTFTKTTHRSTVIEVDKDGVAEVRKDTKSGNETREGDAYSVSSDKPNGGLAD